MIWLSQTLKFLNTPLCLRPWATYTKLLDHVTGNDFSKIVESPAYKIKKGANFQKLIIETKGNIRHI